VRNSRAYVLAGSPSGGGLAQAELPSADGGCGATGAQRFRDRPVGKEIPRHHTALLAAAGAGDPVLRPAARNQAPHLLQARRAKRWATEPRGPGQSVPA
jgi:hypothetical protein